jgi:hypothetical protein
LLHTARSATGALVCGQAAGDQPVAFRGTFAREGLSVGCIGREDLLVNKRAAGRPQDLVDVANLDFDRHPAPPCRLELDAEDGGEDIDAGRDDADLEDDVRARQVLVREVVELRTPGVRRGRGRRSRRRV